MTTQALETEFVDQYRIACDGGEGALGHPRVWLQISETVGFVECPYCDKKIIHRDFEGKID
ncbi:MAG: zinc-finger domain-containing protein [Litoreibacter sp.]